MLSVYLLFLWYFNKWLSDRTTSFFYLKAIALNGFLAIIVTLLVWAIAPTRIDVSEGFHLISLFRVIFVSIIFVTIQQSLKTIKKVEKLKSENLALKTEKYKAELDQLRKQVNPHFLFKSLGTLRGMVRSSDPNAEVFLMNLSSIYRQLLQTSDRPFVTLAEEAETLSVYLFVMKARHEAGLDTKLEVNEDLYDRNLPAFAIQLLVENCINHNMVSNQKPLKIRIFHEDDNSIMALDDPMRVSFQ
jgi:LytS/YehU family sensor histidine kinase